MLAYRAIIAIVQLIFFVPSFGLAILLASRHGFGKSAGWYFLIAFTLVRIVGPVCEIIALQSFSTGVLIAALVCSSIGLAPLTLLCLGMLARVNNNSTLQLPQRAFKLISLLSLVGLALAIAGAVKQDDGTSTTVVPITPESKAAILIFVVIYLSTILILGFLSARISCVAAGEKRLLLAVALSIPFIAVRLAYSLISVFSSLQSFSLAFGDPTIYLCMNVIMEIIVTIIVIAFGLCLRVLPKGVEGHPRSEATEASKA